MVYASKANVYVNPDGEATTAQLNFAPTTVATTVNA